VTNRLGDVLATPVATSQSPAEPDCSTPTPEPHRYVFTDPRARRFFTDWDDIADEQVFDLWLAPSVENSEWLTAELTPIAGPDFTAV